MTVKANWRVTFRFHEGAAYDVNLASAPPCEQAHENAEGPRSSFLRPGRCYGVTTIPADRALDGPVAVMVNEPEPTTETVKPGEVLWPAGMTTVAGIVVAPALLLARLTVIPPAGALGCAVTVPV